MKILAAIAAIAVFVTMALAGPDMVEAGRGGHSGFGKYVVVVYVQVPEGAIQVQMTSPGSGLPSACDPNEDLAGCINALADAFYCRLDSAAPPFSDTDQGGLVYTLVCKKPPELI